MVSIIDSLEAALEPAAGRWSGANERRILDVSLAEHLGYRKPRMIRTLIGQDRAELERYGGLPRTDAGIWLNKNQMLIVALHSHTPMARVVRAEFIKGVLAASRRDIHQRTPFTAAVAAVAAGREPVFTDRQKDIAAELLSRGDGQ